MTLDINILYNYRSCNFVFPNSLGLDGSHSPPQVLNLLLLIRTLLPQSLAFTEEHRQHHQLLLNSSIYALLTSFPARYISPASLGTLQYHVSACR